MDILKEMDVEYVARMDADDVCIPQRFERQIQYLDSHPEIDILGSNAVLFMKAKRVLLNLPTILC